ncbi:hypothetical protein [Oceanobacillus locisalsi]|uniref:Uncharacterized protein n=1 Tax=Oceanobacillus locisalsi TaxID=546107 RepID=A0ABW3NNW2_9BACI
MLNWIRDYWTKSMEQFISNVFKEPGRTSKGRRRMEHERIFEETLEQYETGEAEHLDDLTLNSII